MAINHLIGNISEIVVPPRRVFVREDDSETILIDTGDENVAPEIVKTLKKGFDTVDKVYLTHSGSDHYGGLSEVVEAFDPDVYAAAKEAPLLDNIDITPDIFFEDGEKLPGNAEVIQIPGHSTAPSALLFHDESTLISGDVLDGADRRGFPEGYLLPPPAIYNDDHAAAEKGLQRLLDYEFKTVLVFHGSHVFHNARKKVDKFVNFKCDYRNSKP